MSPQPLSNEERAAILDMLDRTLRAAYKARRRFVSRRIFSEKPRIYDRAAQRACEAVIDTLEMAEMYARGGWRRELQLAMLQTAAWLMRTSSRIAYGAPEDEDHDQDV